MKPYNALVVGVVATIPLWAGFAGRGMGDKSGPRQAGGAIKALARRFSERLAKRA